MEDQFQLKYKNNQVLVSELSCLVKQERELLTKILHYLKELDARKLYLKLGYSSLFSYVTEALGYSEAAAQRRIYAMRLIRDLPEVEDKIESGKISLSVASQMQSFFQKEAKSKKEQEKLNKAQKLELINQLEGISSRNCEKVLAAMA